jgi:HlyD family secretion protein
MSAQTSSHHSLRWLGRPVAALLVAGAAFYLTTQPALLAQIPLVGSTLATTLTGESAVTSTASDDATAGLPTVTIQSADVVQTAISAAGNLALVSQRNVPLAVDGRVAAIAVAVGDQVKAGDMLLQLEVTDLQRAVDEAALNVESARLALVDLQTPATASALQQAQATLVEAQESLADIQAGPSAAELAAARSSLAAAQASYSELQAGPSAVEITQLSADLKKADLTLADAQRAYDQVAWQNSSGMSSQATELQSATIDYESTQAAYTQATAAATSSTLQSAVSSIQNAQVQLEELLNSPSAAEIAAAEAQVAAAVATLAELEAGAAANEVRSAEISLEHTLMSLESAWRDLADATLRAPVDGVVIAVAAEVGVRSAADAVVVTLTDPDALQLEISVAEADITRVTLGQQAEIEIDALPGETWTGVVAAIAPVNDSDASSVSYPVTVRLTGAGLTGVRPGMNAVATLTEAGAVPENSWMVPTNGLRDNDGEATVTVVRNGQAIPLTVTPGTIQGEWTMVQSTELQAGDAVVGSITSSSGESSFGGPQGGFAGGGMMPPSGGPPTR